MAIILFNFSWMIFNILLALLAVFFGWLFYLTNKKILRIFSFVLWILFIPNTIYLFTDLINIPAQWGIAAVFEKIVFTFQYGLLPFIGLITFILSVHPFELMLQKYIAKSKKRYADWTLILLNFIVGFGVVLGRVERLNSWEAITNPVLAINAGIHILTMFDLLLLTALFGLFANFVYYLFRKPIVKLFSTYLSRFGV